MIYGNVGGIRVPLNQDLVLEFCGNQKQFISILSETHINHDQMHHLRHNWYGPIFFFPGDSATKGLLILHHLGLEVINEVETDLKGRFVSFRVTPSNDRALCVYAPSEYSTRQQLARRHFFKRLQNYMENKIKRKENKIILKMDRDGENKPQIFYRSCSNYVLPKLIVNNGLESLWRRENPDSPEFTRYHRSFGKDLG